MPLPGVGGAAVRGTAVPTTGAPSRGRAYAGTPVRRSGSGAASLRPVDVPSPRGTARPVAGAAPFPDAALVPVLDAPLPVRAPLLVAPPFARVAPLPRSPPRSPPR